MRFLFLLSVALPFNAVAAAAPLVASESPVYGQGASSLLSYQQEAVQAIRGGDIPGALKTLEEGVSSDASMSPAGVLLAGLLQSEGQPEAARMALEQAVVRHQNDPEPHLVLGDLAWRQRRLSDAALQYQRGRELAGEMPADSPRKQKLAIWALAGLGSVAETRNQFDRARAFYSEVLELEPKHGQVNRRLGAVLFAQGDESEAFETLRRAVSGQDAEAKASLMMVELCQKAGQHDQAVKWAQRAVEESPEMLGARLALATLLFDGSAESAAVSEAVAAAQKLAPESRDVRSLAALVAWANGELEEAQELLETLAIEEPGDPMSNAYLASVLAERGGAERIARAQQIATLNASSNKSSAPAATAYGWVFLQADQTQLAVRQLEASVRVDGADPDARYYYARALFRGGQAGAAREQLIAALLTPGRFIHRAEAERMARQLGLAEPQE